MSTSRPGSRPVGPAGVLLIVCVLLGSGAGGFLAYHLFRPSASTLYPDQTPAATAETDAALAGAAAREGAAAGNVPQELPDLALPALDGRTQPLRQWRGKPLLINFWATWCEPCRREIPLLQALRRQRAAQRLEIVGIAVDSADATREYARSQGIDYPVLVGQQGGLEAVKAFGMETALPFSVFVDARGRIFTLKVGELHRDEAELILDRLADVDTGRVSAAQARSELSVALQRLNAARIAEGAR